MDTNKSQGQGQTTHTVCSLVSLDPTAIIGRGRRKTNENIFLKKEETKKEKKKYTHSQSKKCSQKLSEAVNKKERSVAMLKEW